MRIRLSAAVAAIACTLALAPAALGWGGDGHQLTALIAELHMTPSAKAGVEALLGKDKNGEQSNIRDAAVASWADEIKRDRKETGPYHYVDIPVGAGRYDAGRDADKGNNVIDKITFYADQLRDTKRPKAEREEALKWVVHLVGDLHQPLHCAERDKDRGGNAVMCFLLDQKGKAGNLHSVWDSGILRLVMNKRPVTEVAERFNAQITPKQIEQWSRGTPADWANESHAVAVKVVYAGVPAPGGPPPRLDQKYVDRASPVIVEQINKGGIRLASILNKCFASRR